MNNDQFVRRLVKKSVVGILYKTEGSGMGNEHSVIDRIYVGESRDEIEHAIIIERNISGSIEEWMNRAWASLVYYDDQAEAEVKKDRETPPDQPTKVRLIRNGLVVQQYGKAVLKFGNVSYAFDPEKELGIARDFEADTVVDAGREFTVPYQFAKFLISSSAKAFELVGSEITQ